MAYDIYCTHDINAIITSQSFFQQFVDSANPFRYGIMTMNNEYSHFNFVLYEQNIEFPMVFKHRP